MPAPKCVCVSVCVCDGLLQCVSVLVCAFVSGACCVRVV